MIEGSNYVRLPDMAEVREAASNVDNMSRLALLPLRDKTWILDNLATNRTSLWPSRRRVNPEGTHEESTGR